MFIEPVDTRFQDRWAAWQEQGAARDRVTRQRLMIMGLVAAVAATMLLAL